MRRLVRKGIDLVGKLAARVTSSTHEPHNELSLIGTMLSERIQMQKTKARTNGFHLREVKNQQI